MNTETFEVADKPITRVKKKKIYKKRGEEKVLVRIIKNHCNRGGEVVKTETIVMPEQSATIGEEEKVFLFIYLVTHCLHEIFNDEVHQGIVYKKESCQ